MTDAVQQLLASFDELSPAERLIVLKELDKRAMPEVDHSPLSDEELTSLADELFQMYDREESENA